MSATLGLSGLPRVRHARRPFDHGERVVKDGVEERKRKVAVRIQWREQAEPGGVLSNGLLDAFLALVNMQKRARSPFSDDQMSSSSPKRATSEEQPDDSPNARREPNLASDERNDDLADAGSQLGMLDNTDTERSHPHVIPDGEGELSLEEKYKWIESESVFWPSQAV
jgi:hypothetical protein